MPVAIAFDAGALTFADEFMTSEIFNLKPLVGERCGD